jgi:NAD-dependent SIR2 family protein deacetylase
MTSAINPTIFSDAARLIEQADALLICAGAGMGFDSTLPDFRDSNEFWEAYPVLKKENLTFSDLADPEVFDKNSPRAWGFYDYQYKLFNQTTPHDGYQILKRWSSSKDNPSFIYTSNVDGHFQKAGFKEEQILECNGSINFLQCSRQFGPPCIKIWPAEESLSLKSLSIDTEKLVAQPQLPLCPCCYAVARPNTLMLNDYWCLSERVDAQEVRFKQWKDNLDASSSRLKQKILVIEIGVGTEIPTVRHLAESMNTDIIRINPKESQGAGNVLSIPAGGLEILQEIDNVIRGL